MAVNMQIRGGISTEVVVAPKRLSVPLTEEQWLKVLRGLRSQSSWLLAYRTRSRKAAVQKAIDEEREQLEKTCRQIDEMLERKGSGTRSRPLHDTLDTETSSETVAVSGEPGL